MDATDHVAERDRLMDLCKSKGTLDGKPCHLSGRLQAFATVWQMGKTWHVQAEYSWPTVARVLARDGRFRTH